LIIKVFAKIVGNTTELKLKLYIITYDSAHWCGGELNCVVTAASPEHAVLLAEHHMAECQLELFDDEYQEEEWLQDECPYQVTSVEVLDPSNEHWEFYNNPSQSSFYPVVS